MFFPFNLRARHGRIGRVLLGCACVAATFAAPPAVDFSMRPADNAVLTSTDGTVTLTWGETSEGRDVELQQAATPAFAEPQVRYRGPDEGSVLTGLPEGQVFFRIRAIGAEGEAGPWSEPLHASVEFMVRGKLFLLLGLGGFVVVMTIGGILLGVTRPEPKRKIDPEEAA